MRSYTHECEGWTLTSYGKGLAYRLRTPEGSSVFFQGDGALEFEAILESYYDNFPDLTYAQAWDRAWGDNDWHFIATHED